jgi:F-type H+-transporting ATPase subunit b
MLTFPPDFSFIIQIISFFVLWVGLKRLLFDPMLHLLAERESRTAGARHAAEEMQRAAVVSQSDYERRMHDVRLRLAADAEVVRNTIQNEERSVLAEAREHASAQLMQLRASLSRQAEAARPALAAEAQTLSGQLLEQVVGRKFA